MFVNTSQFCSLATAPKFLSWLKGTSADAHADLLDHLRKHSSCRANTQKMLTVLDSITRLSDGEQKLTAFLRQHFPHVLTSDALLKYDNNQDNGIFDHYDPDLLTIPRRIIMDGDNLKERIEAFAKDKAMVDYVIIEGRAYIEYLTQDLISIAASIPADNWHVRRWRKDNQSEK